MFCTAPAIHSQKMTYTILKEHLVREMLVGNPHASSQFTAWLEDASPAHSVLVLWGPSGVGKTHLVCEACQRLGKVLYTVDSQTVSSFKEAHDLLFKWGRPNILSQTGCCDFQDTVLLVDELDALVAMDRIFATGLVDVLKSGRLSATKMVVTATSEYRKLAELSCCRSIKVPAPASGDVLAFLRSRAPSTHTRELLRIADDCMGSISHALNALLIDTNRDDKPAVEWRSATEVGGDALEAVYATGKLADARQYMLTDPIQNAMHFHENALRELDRRKASPADRHAAYVRMLDQICAWAFLLTHNSHDMACEVAAQSILALARLPRRTGVADQDGGRSNFTRMLTMLSSEKRHARVAHRIVGELDASCGYLCHVLSSVTVPRRRKKTNQNTGGS